MEIERFVVADAAAWRAWLEANDDTSDGVWLALAKKGVTEPTSLTYDEALDEALCSGWIDGQKRGWDETTFLQRFTPRRSRSLWSQRNLGLVARLLDEQRMRDRGRREIERAQADGRWERAYAGARTAVVPDDLAAALAASPAALELFGTLSSTNRYAVLHRIMTASTPATRQRHLEKLVGDLAEGRTPYPQ